MWIVVLDWRECYAKDRVYSMMSKLGYNFTPPLLTIENESIVDFMTDFSCII